MKYLLAMAVFLGGMLDTSCQNLVSNPDFSRFSSCPPYLGQIHLAEGWDSNFGTTDYFHLCSDSSNGNSIPGNRMGRQDPVSGSGYAGLRLWNPPGTSTPNQREYLVAKLKAPLERDSLYKIEFFASLSDFCTHSTDALGLGFSAVPFSSQVFQPFRPAVSLPEGQPLKTRNSWTHISGSYRAEGNEAYLIIGNWRDDSSMQLVDMPPLLAPGENELLAAYAYIDQVSIVRDWGPPDSLPKDSIQTQTCPGASSFLTFSYDTLVCEGDAWGFQAPPWAVHHRWENGDTLPFREFREAGTYQLTSYFPCDTLRFVLELRTQNCTCPVEVYNVFTPNGDGVNDRFAIKNEGETDEETLLIFDRWGRRVYKGIQNEARTWDGIANGQAAREGVYYWQYSFLCKNSLPRQRVVKRGNLSLIR